MTIPTFFVCETNTNSDMQEHPSEREAILQASGARLKDLVWGANHGYRPQEPKAGDEKQRDQAAQTMLEFIQKPFPEDS